MHMHVYELSKTRSKLDIAAVKRNMQSTCKQIQGFMRKEFTLCTYACHVATCHPAAGIHAHIHSHQVKPEKVILQPPKLARLTTVNKQTY